MRILVTNDDGITAPGLAVAEAIAADIAGPDGEVWVVAPATEQSGVGHCISYTSPSLVTRLGQRRYSIQGTPADCVMAGHHHIMPDAPDLVISGVNRGNNAAENALYSGTLGAAMEAALQGLRGIALSAFLGPDNINAPFEASAAHGTAAVRKILDMWPADQAGYGLFWNVNFPPIAPENVGDLRITPQGYRGNARMGMTASQSPNGREYMWVTGSSQDVGNAEQGTDIWDLSENAISATPMRADLTDHALIAALKDAQG